MLTTWDATPGWNMALDEALLLKGPADVSVLRIYTWSPDTLSLGYFQRLADVPAAQRFFDAHGSGLGATGPAPLGAAMPGAVVRRLTGGGAIHHQHELTFSITTRLDHPLYQGTTARSYERVHAALAGALHEMGVAAHPRGAALPRSEREGTGMCFHKSAAVDLVWGDLKGVGSAQRRRGNRVLHHGSIKLGTTPLEGEIATLDVTPAALSQAVQRALLGASSATIDGETGSPARDLRAARGDLGATAAEVPALHNVQMHAVVEADLDPAVCALAADRQAFFTSAAFLTRR